MDTLTGRYILTAALNSEKNTKDFLQLSGGLIRYGEDADITIYEMACPTGFEPVTLSLEG